jgi:hypothetical protein
MVSETQNGGPKGSGATDPGPVLTFDAQRVRFAGEFAEEANLQLTRADRNPCVVPNLA